eukprot:7453619-Pyramimonas_sp.AAC.1
MAHSVATGVNTSRKSGGPIESPMSTPWLVFMRNTPRQSRPHSGSRRPCAPQWGDPPRAPSPPGPASCRPRAGTGTPCS